MLLFSQIGIVTMMLGLKKKLETENVVGKDKRGEVVSKIAFISVFFITM